MVKMCQKESMHASIRRECVERLEAEGECPGVVGERKGKGTPC